MLETPARRHDYTQAATAAVSSLRDARALSHYADERARVDEVTQALAAARYVDALRGAKSLASGARSLHTRAHMVDVVANVATLLALEVD